MRLRSTLCRVMVVGLFSSGWMPVAFAQESAVEETAAKGVEAAGATVENEVDSLTDRLVEIGRARVEQRELRVHTLRKLGELHQQAAQNRIESSKARLEGFSAELKASQVELQARESEYTRLERLRSKNVVEKQAVTEADRKRQLANAKVGSARAALDQAEAELRSAEFQRQEMKLEAALRVSEATLELLDARAELARDEHTQRRIRSMRFYRSGRDRGDDTPPADSSDSSADPPQR
jgi:hypothetical protein